MDSKEELKTPVAKDIGRRISSQRLALGISREQLAKRMGVTAKFIADIEYGDKGMSLQTLYKFMQTLELSADFILTGESRDTKAENGRLRQIRESIIAPLLNCDEHELKCMEEIARQYVQALKSKEK